MTTVFTPILRRSIDAGDLITRWLDLVAEIGNRFSDDDRETALPRDSLFG
jgi:hypothetical protein